jgi:alpha-tubulin suppressor-like RCC1 family protein
MSDPDFTAENIANGVNILGITGTLSAGGIGFRKLANSLTFHSCGIKTDGTAWCWGENRWSQLGIGISDGRRYIPTIVADPGPWRDISNGGKHTCGLKANGTAWCWGIGSYGQLGNGATNEKSIPTEVSDLGPWQSISVGGSYSCGIKANGTAWCWGVGRYGEIGDGTTYRRLVPVAVSDPGPWAVIEASRSDERGHTCGIKSDGTLWCWGAGSDGQLGLGTGYTPSRQKTPASVADAGPWQMVSNGEIHTCGVKVDGTGWCWGAGSDGQLGNGGAADQLSPVQISEPGPWKDIEAGQFHTCGLKVDGTLWCWGAGSYGQLGNGGTAEQLLPVQISELGPWMSLSVGLRHTCSRKTVGSTWCWGYGFKGSLGIGPSGNKLSPSEIEN